MMIFTFKIYAIFLPSYTYILEVDGKSLKRFVENRKKACRTWTPHVGGNPHRVVLGKVLYFIIFETMYDRLHLSNFGGICFSCSHARSLVVLFSCNSGFLAYVGKRLYALRKW